MNLNRNHKPNFDPYCDNKWLLPTNQFTKWITHLFMLVGYQKVLLVQRAGSSRSIGTVSETFELKDMEAAMRSTTGRLDPLVYTAQRGASEELGIELGIGSIRDTGFQFQAFSPKGNHLIGKTFYTQIDPVHVDRIKLNSEELSSYCIVGFDDALRMMHHPEAIFGLKTIYSKTLF